MARLLIRRSVSLALAWTLASGFLLAQDSSTQAARAAVDAWLLLTDGQRYAESWDAAASLFRSAITKEKWSEALQAVRAPLGQMKSRVLKNTAPTTPPPPAPTGEYVVFQFNTDFDQRSATVETVTVFKEKDGVWRVAGYFIQ
jgi:hypothetical protein